MLLHYGFAFPPGMNKLSFIKCTIKDVTEAIHFLYQTPQGKIHNFECLKFNISSLKCYSYSDFEIDFYRLQENWHKFSTN